MDSDPKGDRYSSCREWIETLREEFGVSVGELNLLCDFEPGTLEAIRKDNKPLSRNIRRIFEEVHDRLAQLQAKKNPPPERIDKASSGPPLLSMSRQSSIAMESIPSELRVPVRLDSQKREWLRRFIEELKHDFPGLEDHIIMEEMEVSSSRFYFYINGGHGAVPSIPLWRILRLLKLRRKLERGGDGVLYEQKVIVDLDNLRQLVDHMKERFERFGIRSRNDVERLVGFARYRIQNMFGKTQRPMMTLEEVEDLFSLYDRLDQRLSAEEC